MNEHDVELSSSVSKRRLETLFDGIFAIAMTILVLELKVPDLADSHSVAELAIALAHHVATFGSYLLTFLMLGLFWYHHNRQYQYYRFISKGMFALHLVQLVAAAFFPFCAALLGRYPVNRFSALLYVGCVMVYTSAALATWSLAKKSGAIDAATDSTKYLLVRRKLLIGVLLISSTFALQVLSIVAA